MASVLGTALHRHRAVSLAALIILTVLAWVWLFSGAGTGMGMHISFAPPQPAGGAMASMAPVGHTVWSPGYFALVFSMWWIMMVAMMLPSAAPTILLHARVTKSAQPQTTPATGAFLSGYLSIWGGFSLAAAAVQYMLEHAGVLAPMLMSSQSNWLSATILVAAGIYQISPLKDACLRHCRSPAHFLSHHYRPGGMGAFTMGMVHGAYCVGCCWLLMALLFVGGVMNLAWIALLTLMVAAEKLLPFGRLVSIAVGVACVAWGLVLFLS